jgi:hypothetical protein
MITITTPATSQRLVTVESVRSVLGLADRQDDELLRNLCDRASDVIARHCKRVFGLETVEETLRLRCATDGLILARYPIAAVASIVENGVTLAASDYEIEAEPGFLCRLTGDRETRWPAVKIIATYSAGYDLPNDTPNALKQAAIELVKAFYMGADRDPAVRNEGVDNLSSAAYYGPDAGADIPPSVRGFLGSFRNTRLR